MRKLLAMSLIVVVAGCDGVLGVEAVDADVRIAPAIGQAFALAIHEDGRVLVGVQGRDFFWNPGTGDTASVPFVGRDIAQRGLNVHDVVVGSRGSTSSRRPFRWAPSTGAMQLPLPAGRTWWEGRATAVNDQDVIVGWGLTVDAPEGPHPLLWLSDGSVLTTVGAPDSVARFRPTVVGPAGAVWGSVERPGSRPVIRWTGAGLEVTGHPAGFPYTRVLDVDDAGRVLVEGTTSDPEGSGSPEYATFIHDGRTFTRTAILARTMNGAGALAGCPDPEHCRVLAVWRPDRGTRTYRVDRYFENVIFTEAVDLNDAGEVAGTVTFDGGRRSAAFRLRDG